LGPDELIGVLALVDPDPEGERAAGAAAEGQGDVEALLLAAVAPHEATDDLVVVVVGVGWLVD
jgi:hypothetical protein